MGFYSPATLVKDAQRHGVEVRAVDVLFSRPRADLETASPDQGGRRRRAPAVRIGLDSVGGLATETAEAIVRERTRQPFENLGDLVRRVGPDRDELEALAELGALAGLRDAPGSRRGALWQVAALERDPRSLFAGRARARSSLRSPARAGDQAEGRAERDDSPLAPMSALEETLADYRLAGLTTGVHLMKHLRPALERRGLLPAGRLHECPDGAFVRTAGHAIVRQRPGSARGFCFLTLEDETGLANAVLTPDMAARFRVPLHQAAILEVAGPLQKVDGVIHVRVRELFPVDLAGVKLPASHDYR
jgi:error-prone DNA polymerase